MVDLRGVHKLQDCHGVLLQEDTAGPLLPDVISIIQVLVLNVDPVICVEAAVSMVTACLHLDKSFQLRHYIENIVHSAPYAIHSP